MLLGRSGGVLGWRLIRACGDHRWGESRRRGDATEETIYNAEPGRCAPPRRVQRHTATQIILFFNQTLLLVFLLSNGRVWIVWVLADSVTFRKTRPVTLGTHGNYQRQLQRQLPTSKKKRNHVAARASKQAPDAKITYRLPHRLLLSECHYVPSHWPSSI